MKLFVDDLELAIQKSQDPEFRLLDMDLEKVDQEKIGDYIKSHFKINIDTKSIDLEFLGCELDENALLCYLEAKRIKRIRSFEVYNSLITNAYDDQINLLHFQYRDQNKSLRTNVDQPEGNIDTSLW